MNAEETKKAAEVMLAWANGEKVESRSKGGDRWLFLGDHPCWDWDSMEYRIKPKEPREWWALMNESGKPVSVMVEVKETESRPKAFSSTTHWIRVREVLEG